MTFRKRRAAENVVQPGSGDKKCFQNYVALMFKTATSGTEQIVETLSKCMIELYGQLANLNISQFHFLIWDSEIGSEGTNTSWAVTITQQLRRYHSINSM